MKKFSLIISFALFCGLLCLLFLWQNKQEVDAEVHEQTYDASVDGKREMIQAIVAEGDSNDESSQGRVETIEGSTQTPWEKGNLPERLQVADLDIPLVFEGQVTEELKQVILADIHMLYNAGVTYEKYDWSGRPDNPVFDFSGKRYVSSETINLRASQVPNIVHEKLGRMIQVEGIDNIVVSAELISAYQEAWDFRKANPKKYESLVSFIAWVNTAPMEDLKAKNPYWLFGYDGISDAYPERAEELKESLLPKEREDLQVSYPSILEFTYIDSEVLKNEGAEEQLPVGVTLADGKYIDNNGVPYQQALFLYDGEKWHIAFAPAGT
ncbi:hypothetical protein [Puniceicoccus vermicola]|uniref:Uncharacterized protein n=1 Tax=Puniceicoccus vermicola TaxID=388746 RepID=A0A7X1E3A1_9BACT|nr:hypothetical protein [Puniceicoccus vermicola]MBC2600754.1 hypothetical protein [Puniceicoccus vermicola]